MSLHKKICLTLALLLCSFSTGGLAESQSPLKNLDTGQFITKKWKVIDGFRSAKFGMSEKQVMRAIAKDFKVPKIKIERLVTPLHKTTALIIHLPKLMEIGGPADIVYILGYKSKKLIQVNVDWGKGVSDNFTAEEIMTLLSKLRTHFMKDRYKKGIVFDSKASDTRTIVFRGKDLKDRMILLYLDYPKPKELEDKKETGSDLRLILSYLQSVENPDHFK